MAHSPMDDLRFPVEKGGAPNRKDPLDFDTFIVKWRELLEGRGVAGELGQAIAELRQRRVLNFLFLIDGRGVSRQAHDLLGTILDEMRVYRNEACGRLTKEYYSDAKKFLYSEIERIQRQKERNQIKEIKRLLESVEKKLSRSIQTLDWLKERRRNWRFGTWQHLWHDVPRDNMVERKPGLDTRLQLQVGKILGDYLLPEDVSVETIARLIVLAYCAGELAEWEGEVLRTTYTHRVLKVRNVRDILRKRNLVKSYNSREAS